MYSVNHGDEHNNVLIIIEENILHFRHFLLADKITCGFDNFLIKKDWDK